MNNPFSKNVSVFVNSSDGFVDCWAPFFTLFDHYWPEHGPVLLNTESVNWCGAPDYVQCSQIALDQPVRLSWSECAIRGLRKIRTPLVLYFQEDYFLDRRVQHNVIQAATELMMADPAIGHVALTRHGSLPPFAPSPYAGFETIAPTARYRVSTQAGLWRRDVLLSYLDPSENGWMFEILGTLRARRRADTFLVARYDKAVGGPAIHYTHTGIIKGQWHRDIPELFAQHGIRVPFEQRGFHNPPKRLFAKMAVARKLAERPGHVLRQLLTR